MYTHKTEEQNLILVKLKTKLKAQILSEPFYFTTNIKITKTKWNLITYENSFIFTTPLSNTYLQPEFQFNLLCIC